MTTDPLALRVKPSTPSPVEAFETKAMSPVGFAVPALGVTVTFTVTLCPAVIPVRGDKVKLVVVGVKRAEMQRRLFVANQISILGRARWGQQLAQCGAMALDTLARQPIRVARERQG